MRCPEGRPPISSNTVIWGSLAWGRYHLQGHWLKGAQTRWLKPRGCAVSPPRGGVHSVGGAVSSEGQAGTACCRSPSFRDFPTVSGVLRRSNTLTSASSSPGILSVCVTVQMPLGMGALVRVAKSCLILWDPWTLSHHALCPWNSPGKNPGAGCHFLRQGIFPTQGLSPCLSHCREIFYQWAIREALMGSLVLLS